VTSQVDLEAELKHGHQVPSPNKNGSCHGDMKLRRPVTCVRK